MLKVSTQLDSYTQNNSDEKEKNKPYIEGTQVLGSILILILIFKMIKWIPQVDCFVNKSLGALVNDTTVCEYSIYQ
jgi:hypothetical protein